MMSDNDSWIMQPADFPPLPPPKRRGGWNVIGGLFGGHPPNRPPKRNLFPEEIQAALEDSSNEEEAAEVVAAVGGPAEEEGAADVVAAVGGPAPSTPSALLCKYCLESKSQHKCSKCGQVS